MELAIFPLLGPFHLRSPAWNAVTVRDAVAAWEPVGLATTALDVGSGPADSLDTAEIALPLAVIPWARRKGLVVVPVGEPEPEPGAEEAFRRYADPYPDLKRRIAEADSHLGPVEAALGEPLTHDAIRERLLPALRRYQEEREAKFGDGPASGWLRRRMEASAERILDSQHARLALLLPVEHIPFLDDALRTAGVEAAFPPPPATTPQARERAVLDFAFRGDAAEPGPLLESLRGMAGAEARFHEANLLLANGHGREALDLLERTSHGDFSEPYFLPGYLLARLGQLRDLAGRREDAIRAYRGTLALDWAPAEAVEAARAGLERPFEP